MALDRSKLRPSGPLYRKPGAAEHGKPFLIENLSICNVVDVDSLGVRVNKTSAFHYCFSSVTVRNVELGKVERSPGGAAKGLHVDHGQFTFGGNEQPIDSDLTFEDVSIHDGDGKHGAGFTAGDTLLIQDGKFGTITLRRVEVSPQQIAYQPIKIVCKNSGYVKRVIVEDCHDLRIQCVGQVGPVKLVNCRNVTVTGATVEDQQTPPIPATPPADPHLAEIAALKAQLAEQSRLLDETHKALAGYIEQLAAYRKWADARPQ